MKNTGFLGVARRYLLHHFFHFYYIIFSKIFTLTTTFHICWQCKKIIFSLKFLCASHLKIKHFELPPACKIQHMKTKLTEMHN